MENIQKLRTKGFGDNKIQSYQKLKSWIEDSLDSFRGDLLQLLYPLFVHYYLDFMSNDNIDEGKKFFESYSEDLKTNTKNNSELVILESISSPLHVRENSLSNLYRNNKYKISMGKYAFDLFINFLEENHLTYILKIVNQYLDIKIKIDIKPEECGVLDNNVNDVKLDLNTFLTNKRVEDAIINDEQYKYDHLESFVSSLKKHRESKNTEESKVCNFPASTIFTEIENLKDLCNRISISPSSLPSICCYTIHNTYGNLTAIEFSNDIKLLACGYKDSYIELYSLTEEPLKKLKTSAELGKTDKDDYFVDVGRNIKLIGHSSSVFSLKFSQSKKLLLSCSSDCSVKLWSLDLFTCISTFKSQGFPIWSVDFCPNDVYILSGSADKKMSMYSMMSNKEERIFTGFLSDVATVAFHPNGNYVFGGGCDNKIRMFNVQDGSCVRIFSGHTDIVTCLEVSYCGKYFLSGGKDKIIYLWDIETGASINKFVGHEKTIYSLSFSYFALVIASSAADNTVRLWDRSDHKGTCLGVYSTKSTPISAIKFGFRNILSVAGPFLGA
ncbi:Transcription initiation factor TFIID 90KDa [Spraguea lophii 42_110]|uniref:Transcription initiation factor TFIID 90KDa n=1 Tax=Spraguea lophii (strain 42_110) TaxID=1358809 RepID=S7W9E2_SPRLO|nr:Transcription initiation factor TFIID 90KDa [Spraguea lophii 42_110]